MEVKLQLSVFLLLVQGSLAFVKHVAVMNGQTVRLRCPISSADRSPVEWRNPEGLLMFFDRNKALKDKRYSITRLSQSVFSISISNISFRDGGNYTCSHYGHPPTEKKVEVTVIGHPRLSVTEHGGTFSIKCSAQATASPPLLSWRLDHGAELSVAGTHFQREKKKHVSESIINLQSLQGRVTVHCLLRHPALNSQPLMNFVKVGRDAERSGQAASSSTTSALPPSSTGGPAAGGETGPPSSDPASSSTTSALPPSSTGGPAAGGETGPPSSDPASSSTTSALPPSSTGGPAAGGETGPPSSDPASSSTASAPPPSFTGGPAVGGETGPPSSDLASTQPHPSTPTSESPPGPEHLSTQGWASDSETTEYITSSSNSTKRNNTGNYSSDLQVGVRKNSTLLVFLVTCLITGLLVVVLFLAVKLRKAHAAWRKENDESDPSEESSKSKSSQEEKHVQRRRGLYNTTFAQYIVQEPTVMVPEVDAAAQTVTDSGNLHLSSHPEPATQTFTRQDAKETSL